MFGAMTTTPAVDPATGLPTDGTLPLDHLALLTTLQEAFAAGTATATASAPVPACGRWTVRDLVEHIGQVHHWAAAQARCQEESPLGPGPFDLALFYREQAAELRGTLASLGPEAESWTLLGQGPATFWRRRQLHETLVHLHDLRAAAAGSATAAAPIAVEPTVWADGVDEVVMMFQPRQVRLGRMAPLARTVRLEATDVDQEWTLGAPGSGTDGNPMDAPAVRVRATARGLDLLLWRRLTPTESGVEIDGDPQALAEALAAAIVP
jgi:uncharacterized protein (TIGR03083 family)